MIRTATIPAALAAAALLFAGCGNTPAPTAEEPAAQAVEVAPEPEPTDFLVQGKAEGYSAAVAAQAAVGNDWGDVGLGWDAALRSLSRVPEDSPDYAEAQAKIEEYTANREVASDRYNAHLGELRRRQAAIDAQPKPIDNYRAALKEIDPQGSLVAKIEPDPVLDDCDTCLLLTVGQDYLGLPQQVQRLEVARNLQTLWVAHSGVGAVDDAYIRLVSQSGQRLGGSRVLGGSIRVE